MFSPCKYFQLAITRDPARVSEAFGSMYSVVVAYRGAHSVVLRCEIK